MKHSCNKKSKEKIKSRIKISLERPLYCKICNKEIKSESGLASHIKNQHDNLSYYEYLKMYYNIDVKNLNKEWDDGREERKNCGYIKTKKNNLKLNLSPKDRMNEDQYKKFRESMNGVYTLEWFIKKYGDEMGEIKYQERSEKISKISHFRKYNKENHQNWSKSSQLLFWDIYNIVNKNFEKIYFGELNHECSGGSRFNFDFVILDNKKVIEFNGDNFHANPNKYNENDIPLKFLKKTAKEIWKQDEIKINKAKEKGFDVKIVWESDYLKNKDGILLECIKFLLK